MNAVVEGARSQNEFWSVDSAPKKFAGKVPQWRALALIVTFCFITFGLLWGINQVPFLDQTFVNDDLIFSPYSGTHSIPVRAFITAFYLSFAIFCSGSWRGKIGIGSDMLFTFYLLCALMDLTNILFYLLLDVKYSLHVIEIISGMIGFAVYSFKLLERGRMPSRIDLDISHKRNFTATLRLVSVGFIAAVTSGWIGALDLKLVDDMRSAALLGGIGPGVFLFLPTLFLILYFVARMDALIYRQADFSPPLTIIVPAHNEEYIIANTIRAMDVAAGNYAGPVEIFIMNNNSEDNTRAIAEETLAACKFAHGRVIDEKRPGKSNALNSGLDAVPTEYFVRVDADTLIGPKSIYYAMRHFADPEVGVVGGLPVPPMGAMFDRARFLEVVVKHGFYSVGMGAVNAVVGIPGMLAIYQTALPRKLGGFVEGMNGEDTDISMRIGEMGYRLVVDPKIRYVSEVPATYHHMREQRMRWFRSVYHISSRCRDLIYSSRRTTRGKVILPYMLINSGRRAMMVPLIAFGCLEYATSFNSANTLEWQAVLAVLVGAPSIMAIFATLLNGMPKGILYVPEYIIFRILRAYFTLESMLSISIKDEGEHIFSRAALARARPCDIRVA